MPATSDRSRETHGTADTTHATPSGGLSGRRESGGIWIVVSLALSVFVAAALVVALDVPFLDAYLLAGLIVLLPGLGVAQARAARQPRDLARIPAYASSAMAISALGGLSLTVGLLGTEPARLGLSTLPAGRFWAVTMALLVGTGLVIASAQIARRSFGLEESPLLSALLPTTPGEKRAFAGLSLVAGLGEEIAYRGYAIFALGAIVGGPWAAAALSSLAFGAVHAYQGAVGVVRTAVLGMVLAVPVVLFGSLWPSVMVHIVIDLVGGLWLGPRMVARPSSIEVPWDMAADGATVGRVAAEL
jgi:membrane protease YdiL (CAAX protease family)